MAKLFPLTFFCRISIFFVLFFLISLSAAGPIRRQKYRILTCSRTCRVPKESKFKFTPGKMYDYSYKVETAIHMAKTPNHSSRLLVQAVASIYVIDTCDMVLKMREVRIMEPDPTAENQFRKSENSWRLKVELERVPLRVSFVDGQIDDVCPAEDETVWALNIKRGFLSIFQNTMGGLKKEQIVNETDVLGTCRTEYLNSGTGWFSNSIRKFKDLSTCTTSSRSPSSTGADAKVLRTLLTGQQECQQTIDWNGVIDSVVCVEQRHFRQLGRDPVGPMTRVLQTAQLLQTRDRKKISPPLHRRMRLEYDHSTPSRKNPAKDRPKLLPAVKNLLRQLCVMTDVVPETTDLFYQLVTNLRSLDGSGLRVVYETVSGASLCSDYLRVKKYFLDALAMAGTDPAVQLLIRMLTSGQDEPVQADLLITSLAFLPSTSSFMLQAAKGLLDQRPVSRAAILTVSSMVHNYCQHHTDCNSNVHVSNILKHFKRAVGPKCIAREVRTDKILLALRAIGNAGQDSGMRDVLRYCLNRKSNPVHVRVTAVQAFRRMPCSARGELAQRRFEDRNEVTELRIASYVTMMQCAEASIFDRLERILADEPNMQLFSFVFTHLTNLKHSSNDQLKNGASKVLSNVDFASKELGRLLLSKNFGGHAESDHLKFDTNLIWPYSSESPSPGSAVNWLPRSLTSNLTVNVLGQDINFAEVGVRSESLAVLFEDVLYPLFGNMKPSLSSMSFEEREKRLGRLKGSMHVRILGNDLAFHQTRGTDAFMKRLASGKLFDLRWLTSALSAEGRTRYSQSLILIDQQLEVATASGLPLTVSLHSALSAQMNLVGTVDFKKAFARPRSVLVEGAIKPSAALRITGSMGLDAKVARVALHMTGTVHTNTIVKGRVHLERGKMVNIEVDMPRKNLTIFDIRTETKFLRNGREYQLTPSALEQREHKMCTGPVGVRLLGLELCGEIRIPKVMSSTFVSDLLSSPSSLSLVLNKEDEFSKYKLMARHLQAGQAMTSQISFNTPGSNIDRNLEAYLDANLDQRYLQITMTSPWKQADLKCSIMDKPKSKGAIFTLTIDKEVIYGFNAAVKVTKSNAGVTYSPEVELQKYGMKPVKLTGKINLERYWKRASVELVLRGLSKLPSSLRGSLANLRREVSVRGSVNLGAKGEYSIACGSTVSIIGKRKPTVALSPFLYVNTPSRQLMSVNGRGDYRKDRFLRADVKIKTAWTAPFTVQCDTTQIFTPKQTTYKIDTKIKSSHAVVTFKASTEVRGRQSLLARVTLTHDIPNFLPKDTISLMTKLVERKSSRQWSGLIHLTLSSKAHANHKIDFKTNADLLPSNTLFKLHYGYGEQVARKDYVSLMMKIRHQVKDIRNVFLVLSSMVDIPAENVHAELKMKHTHNIRLLQSKINLNYGDNQKTQADLTLLNNSTRYLSVVGKAYLQLPQSFKRMRRSYRKKKRPGFEIDMTLTESDHEYHVKTGARTGRRRRKDFFSRLDIKKPVSLKHVQMNFKGTPYSTVYQGVEAEFSHSMHPLLAEVIEALWSENWRHLDITKPLRLLTSIHGATILKEDTALAKMVSQVGGSRIKRDETQYSVGKINSLYSEFVNMTGLTGADTRCASIDIKGGIEAKSSFVDLVTSSLNFGHSFDGNIHETDIKFSKNDDDYNVEMTIKDDYLRWLRYSRGAVIVTTPKRTLNTEWEHEFVDSRLRSYLLTSWNGNRRVYFDLNGQFERTNMTEKLFGDLILQSPWKPVKNWRLSIGHASAPGLFRSKSAIRLDGFVRMSHQVTYLHTEKNTETGFHLVTPWTKKISGSTVLEHNAYPMTLTCEIVWTPQHKVTVTGSVSLTEWDDMEVSSTFKTSLLKMKTISFALSNKIYGENLVSEITAKYGASNTFGMESTVRRHDMGKVRFRLLTPFELLRILETGFQINGVLENGTADADFKIYPSVKKFEGSLVWTYDGNFSGKFRLDTPLKDFSYLQIVAKSEYKGKYRYSVITMKHYPSHVYEIDAKYTLQSPDQLIMTVKIPHEKYDRLDLQLNHWKVGTVSNVSMKMSFPLEQTIIAAGQIDFDAEVQGNLSLQTPFSGFQTCSTSFLYRNMGTELLVVGNFTAESRSANTRVLLLSENIDNSSPVSFPRDGSLKTLYEMVERIKSTTKLKLDFDTAPFYNPMNVGGLLENEATSIAVVYDRLKKTLLTKFQFDSTSLEEITILTNYSKNTENSLLTLSGRYGKDYSLQGYAVVSELNSDSLSKTSALHNDQISHPSSNFTQDIFTDSGSGVVKGATIVLEGTAPFSKYDRFEIQTNFNHDFRHGVRSPENLLLPPTVSLHPAVSVCLSISHSHSYHHRIYFNASHEFLPDRSNTYVDFKMPLEETDDFIVHFSSSGTLNNFTGTAQVDFKGKTALKTVVGHVYNRDLLQSFFDVQTDYLDHANLAVLFKDATNSIVFNSSAGWGETLDVRCIVANSVDDDMTIKTSSIFGIRAIRITPFVTSTDLVYKANDPWNDFSGSINLLVADKHGNISLSVNPLKHLAVSGTLSLQSKDSRVKKKPLISFAYHGQLTDFRSSFGVYSLSSGPVRGDMQVRYLSIFDMDTNMMLKSPFEFGKDLRFVLQSKEQRTGEYRGFMLIGWAPYEEITVDAVSKYMPSVLGLTRQTDVYVVTPFQEFQTAIIKTRHNRILSKTNSSLLAQINGQTVLDLDFGSDDPTTLGIHSSVLGLFHRNAFISDTTSHHGKAFLRWSLTDADSYVRIATRYVTTVQTYHTRSKDLSVEVTHPQRTLVLTYLFGKTPKSATGECMFTWDKNSAADNSVLYSYTLMADVKPDSHTYHGHLKLGCPLRSVEVNGSWAGIRQRRPQSMSSSERVHGHIGWDCDRDKKKRIMVSSLVTMGETISADVAFNIPAAEKLIYLKTDLDLLRNNIIWNSTSSFSFSPDRAKTVTFSTFLSGSSIYGNRINYSMETALAQPSSALDFGITSSVALNESAYRSSFGGWFLTSDKEMKMAKMDCAFNRQTKNLQAAINMPSRKVSMEAELPTKKPYELKARATLHDAENNKQHGFQMLLDPLNRSFFFKIDHDAVNPNNFLALEAWYINNTAVRCELYRKHVNGNIKDGALDIRLNTSTLLHLGLSWRPQLPQELKILFQKTLAQLNNFKVHAEQEMNQTLTNIDIEFRAKVDAVSHGMAMEFSSIIDLLGKELEMLDRDLEPVLTGFIDLYESNIEAFEGMEQVVDAAKSYLLTMAASSGQPHLKVAAMADRLVESLMESSVLEAYRDFYSQLQETIQNFHNNGKEGLNNVLYYADLYLLLVKSSLHELNNEISSFSNVDSYQDFAREKWHSLGMSQGLRLAQERARAWLSPLTSSSPYVIMASSASELYYQGLWLYGYFYASSSIDHHLDSIVNSLKDITWAEINFRLRHFRFLRKSRFSVWQPERGLVKADVFLPYPVQSLVLMPEVPRNWTYF